jgi:hypothetical protein
MHYIVHSSPYATVWLQATCFLYKCILWLQKPVLFLSTHMNSHGQLLFFQMRQYPSSIAPPSFLNKPYPQRSMHCTSRRHQVWYQICNLACFLYDTLKNQAFATSMLLSPHTSSPMLNSNSACISLFGSLLGQSIIPPSYYEIVPSNVIDVVFMFVAPYDMHAQPFPHPIHPQKEDYLCYRIRP